MCTKRAYLTTNFTNSLSSHVLSFLPPSEKKMTSNFYPAYPIKKALIP